MHVYVLCFGQTGLRNEGATHRGVADSPVIEVNGVQSAESLRDGSQVSQQLGLKI